MAKGVFRVARYISEVKETDIFPLITQTYADFLRVDLRNLREIIIKLLKAFPGQFVPFPLKVTLHLSSGS